MGALPSPLDCIRGTRQPHIPHLFSLDSPVPSVCVVATEAELGEKHLTNVAMGNEDEDVIEALGKILVEKFNAKPKVSA
jgi:hypothetical protein